MQENLNISINVDGKEAINTLDNVSKSVKNLGGSTINTSATTNALKQSLNALKKTSALAALTGIANAAKTLKPRMKEVIKQIKLAGKAIRSLYKRRDTGQVSEAYFKVFSESFKKGRKELVLFATKTYAAITAMAALATGVLAGLMARMAIRVSALGKDIHKLSQQLQMSATEYQRWTYIVNVAGVETDAFNGGMRALVKNQAEAALGTENALNKFKQLGITLQDIQELNQEQMLALVVERLQNIEDKTVRAAIAFQIFEEDGLKLGPILNMTANEMKNLTRTQDLLGISMSNSLVKNSAILQQNLYNLRGAWQGLKNSLSEQLIPVITKVVQWLSVLIAKINIVVRAIMGLSGKEISNASDAVSSGVGNIGTTANSATKAVNKLRRSLMGFDELNVLTDNSVSAPDTSIDTSSIVSGFSSGLGELTLFDSETLDKLDRFKAKIDNIKDALQIAVPLFTTLAGLGLALFGALSGNLFALGAGLGLAGIGITIGNANGGWSAMADVALEALKKIGDFVKDLGINVALAFYAIGKTAYDIFFGMLEVVLKIFALICEGVGNALNTMVKIVIDTFRATKEAITTALNNIATTLKNTWENIKAWWKTNCAPKFTRAYWVSVFENIRAALITKVNDIKTGLSTSWTTISNWFKSAVAPKFTAAYWKTKFQGIKDGMKSALNSTISVVESAVNNIIRKINSVGFTLPDWIPHFGGRSFGINMPTISIPRLATGGVVVQETLARIGEGGKREAVLPLEQNTEWMDNLADRIASRNSAPSRIVLQVDGKQLGWATINSINGITKQTGTIPLVI